MTKEEIRKEYLKGKSLRYSDSKNEKIRNFIDNLYPETNLSHREKVYCYINNSLPKCKNPNCETNKHPSLQNFTKGFKDYCSISCAVVDKKSQQEKTRKSNKIKESLNLTPEELVSKIYNKELKVQKWRELPTLKQYINFKSLEQVHNHLVLGINQVCKYCNNPYSINKKTKKVRKCSCTTKEERIILDFDHSCSNEEFLKVIQDNNLMHNLDTRKHKDLLEKEYYNRFRRLPWPNSIIENIYCLEHNITSKPETEFVDSKRGYKKPIYKIDYSKSNIEILTQFKTIFSNYNVNNEFIYWILHFKGTLSTDIEKSINEKSEILEKPFTYVPNVSNKEIMNLRSFKDKVLFLNNNTYQCKKCLNSFTQINNTAKGIICLKCHPIQTGFSKEEKSVVEFIKTIYSGIILENDRSTIGLELDIFLPEINLAIEYNGLYWHSSEFKSPDYHLIKTEKCELKNIQLIHIFSNEWLDKKEIVKRMLSLLIQKLTY